MLNALSRLKNNATFTKDQKLKILNVLYEHFIEQKEKAESLLYKYEEVIDKTGQPNFSAFSC